MRAVYEELHRSFAGRVSHTPPTKLDDGLTFVHVAEENGDTLTDLDAFAEFREGDRQNAARTPPVALAATLVGRYLPG